MGQVQKHLDWYRISCCCCTVLTSIIFRSRWELRGTVSCVCKYVMYCVCFVYVNYGCLWKIVCNFESIKINTIQKKWRHQSLRWNKGHAQFNSILVQVCKNVPLIKDCLKIHTYIHTYTYTLLSVLERGFSASILK